MKINEQEAQTIRDELHNLDINCCNDREIYYNKLYYIISSGEGFSSKVYKDTKGKLTIGYGFNMDRGDASRNEWNKIFNGLIDFDSAKNGDITISAEQARMLKRDGVNKREKELTRIYDPYWNKMRLNERAILTDLYYQAPSLVNGKTRFSKYMKEYYKTGDQFYLDMAVNEVKLHSNFSKNPADIIGLQSRNNIRAIILDSQKSPLYSNPHYALIPKDKEIKVVLRETIIPREISKKFPKSNSLGDYYIWRTLMDDKVRSTHQELEGKVFKHEDKIIHPGDDHGCRCWKQRLPINAVIIGDEYDKDYDYEEYNEKYNKQDLSEKVIRKHITNFSHIGEYKTIDFVYRI